MVAFLSGAMAGLFGGRRRLLVFLPVATIALAGCAQVGGPTLTFWDIIYSMIAFFFWVTIIWIFIAIFGDIFRRTDIHGGARPAGSS